MVETFNFLGEPGVVDHHPCDLNRTCVQRFPHPVIDLKRRSTFLDKGVLKPTVKALMLDGLHRREAILAFLSERERDPVAVTRVKRG